MQVSPEIAKLAEKAAKIAISQQQMFVGVPHLYNAILCDPEVLPQTIRDRMIDMLFIVQREVNRLHGRSHVNPFLENIIHTPRCINILHECEKMAARFEHGPANAGHLLLAVFNDGLSAPSRAMDYLKMNRSAVLRYLQQELRALPRPSTQAVDAIPGNLKAPSQKAGAETVAERATKATVHDSFLDSAQDSPKPKISGNSLPMLTRDLTEAARQGKIEPAIGRDAEMFQVLRTLARHSKNNVIIVGEAGVGKTQLVEGLALRLAKEQQNGSPFSYHFYELNLAALLAGTQYRGAFEEKMIELLDDLKAHPDHVLFVDEFHLIMGAGGTENSSVDLANLLKPALSRGEVRCIGATTLREYRKFVERDPAIERRFQMIRLEPLSEEATLEVLRRLRPMLEKHHGVRVSSRALDLTISLTQRYMPNRNLPDKAIDVLDQTCAHHRLTALAMPSDSGGTKDCENKCVLNQVTPHSIRKVVSQISGIPLQQMTEEERLQLNDLGSRIKRHLIGQDDAVNRIVAGVKKSRVGLADPKRPDIIALFVGPTGVGKTQLAKLLARYLFGSEDHLISFDMTEYVEAHSVSRLLGAPPGYVGHEEEGQLTSAVRDNPFSILLFDEIEKAHQQVFDIFLPILEEGRIKDMRGRYVSFRNCLIIMTSNIGADLLRSDTQLNTSSALMDELRMHFRPEFINRIDEIVPFHPLLSEDVREILRLEINKVRTRLEEKKIGLRMYQRAYEFLAGQGYNEAYGARELRRTVDQHITTPLSALLLKDAYKPGDMIDIKMEGDLLTFSKGEPSTHVEEVAT